MALRSPIALCALAVLLTSCKSVPVAPVVVPAAPLPPVPIDRQAAWILRLEQSRVLRDADETPGAPISAATPSPVIAPARSADLTRLLFDTDPNIRARAALAIGRVGLVEGAAPLVTALGDEVEAVRASAAFALGLIGSADAVPPLTAALKDPSPHVRGRAAEGLGLIGQTAAASSVADAFLTCRRSLNAIAPDDETTQPPEVEACRLALLALVRLKQYDQLARVALDDQGRPVSTWWPVAFALQRIGDKRAAPALLTLASSEGVITPGFALRGLAAAGERQVVPLAQALATRATADVRLRVMAVRALGQVGGAEGAGTLLTILGNPGTPRNLSLEVVAALGVLADPRTFDALVDQLTNGWPSMRAAALTAVAKVDPDGFLLVISSLGPDRDWSVRAQLASVLATLPADRVRSAIQELAADGDARVRTAAVRALGRVGAPDLSKRLYEALDAQDFAVRAAAAEVIGAVKPEGGVASLAAAYTRAESDAAYGARAAALEALSKYASEDAKVVLRHALGDKAWPVRRRAAELLHGIGEPAAAPEMPAPLRQSSETFESEALLHPAFSPHAFLETRAGTIELELNVVEAPFTTQSFVDLARSGFFNGMSLHRVVPNFVVQAGDPRGDGEGGPGFTINDELSTLPFVRGTVGMALDWRDTGGSQFFITVSPQPHLDGKYTVFGRVVNGAALLDGLAQWDVIERVRIWDGVKFQ